MYAYTVLKWQDIILLSIGNATYWTVWVLHRLFKYSNTKYKGSVQLCIWQSIRILYTTRSICMHIIFHQVYGVLTHYSLFVILVHVTINRKRTHMIDQFDSPLPYTRHSRRKRKIWMQNHEGEHPYVIGTHTYVYTQSYDAHSNTTYTCYAYSTAVLVGLRRDIRHTYSNTMYIICIFATGILNKLSYTCSYLRRPQPETRVVDRSNEWINNGSVQMLWSIVIRVWDHFAR